MLDELVDGLVELRTRLGDVESREILEGPGGLDVLEGRLQRLELAVDLLRCLLCAVDLCAFEETTQSAYDC